MPKPRITLALLKEKGACADQVRLFRKHFGDGPAPLNKKTALAMASVFDFHWAANNLLAAPAGKAYNEASATAGKVYIEACAPAWDVYAEACAIAFLTVAKTEYR